MHLAVTGLLVLGTSGASVSGIPRLAWPAGFSEQFAMSNTHPLGECTLLGSVGYVARVTRGTVAGTVSLTTVTWDGTKLIYASVSATAPFTWAAGHSMLYTYRIPGTFT